MIYTGLNRTGEIETVKANGGADVAEVYGGINEANPIYYKTRTLTGTLPLSYKALGKPLSDYLLSGNTVQNGTPTPDNPVDVVGCGAWDETHQSYKLPITVNGTEYPIYLGNVQTTRRIKKYTFTGEEIVSNCVATTDGQNYCVVFRYNDIGMNDIINYEETMADISYPKHVSSHFVNKTDNYSDYRAIFDGQMGANDYGSTGKAKNRYIIFCVAGLTTAADYSAWFAQQYAAGTPVVVWYVLTEQTTGIVNEPLHKIGDYADTITMAQAGVTIPTVAGTNTLTVGTTVQPSAVSITGNIKEVST